MDKVVNSRNKYYYDTFRRDGPQGFGSELNTAKHTSSILEENSLNIESLEELVCKLEGCFCFKSRGADSSLVRTASSIG